MLRFFLISTVWWLALTAHSTHAGIFVFEAGTEDGFSLPSEPTNPSADLISVLGAPLFQDFDLIAGVNGGVPDRIVAHTFDSLPGDIVGASLELRVRAGDLPLGVTTDALILSFVDDPGATLLDQIAWARTFGLVPAGTSVTPAGDPGLLKPASPWAPGDDFFVSLDLAALPLGAGGSTNLLPELNSLRFLDVLVDDETGVDFMRLTVHTSAVPEPTSSAMFAIALMTFALPRSNRSSKRGRR